MTSQKLFFKNKEGLQLSAHLQLPIDQKPIAYALFAHCFTCSKNLHAVRHISQALTAQGFGVLRFDFTGLGESEGDFEDTNFSSNMQDLMATADFLAQEYEAPKLLIGHSLGGAAVLFTAKKIESIQAVVTIGAPANPEHVQHLFANSLDETQESGVAKVKIAGREFTIKKQFLEDISDKNMATTLKNLRKPLLIFHSPQDLTVEVDNARRIYQQAHHPKSFISLDGADHLLSDKKDAMYVGEVIAGWATRYIEIPEKKNLKVKKQVVVRIGNDEGYTTEIKAGKHYLKADEPLSVGGNDFGATPYDLLLASLGACTVMTLKMYANRKKWDLQEVEVHLKHSKEHFTDSNDPSNKKSLIDRIERSIELQGNLDEAQKARLVEMADRCPVHRTLHGKVEVITELAD